MSFDLADVVEDLQAMVDAPGTDSFPDATEDNWISQLRNGFWLASIDGLLPGFEESDGLVVPKTVGADDIGRDLVQVVIFYAAILVLSNSIRSSGNRFRAKAGPVEFETENSAQVQKTLLDELYQRRNTLLLRLSDIGVIPSYYIDAIVARDESLAFGDTYWVSSSVGQWPGSWPGSW